MNAHLEELIRVLRRIVQLLVMFEFLLQSLILDGEIVNDTPILF